MKNDIVGLKEMWEHVAVPSTPDDFREAFIWVVGVAWAAFQLYAGLQYVRILTLVHVHVLTAIALGFALNPMESKWVPKQVRQVLDTVLAVVPLVILVYLIQIEPRLMQRVVQVGEVTTIDLIAATLTVLLLLEVTRRIVGRALPIIAVVFIAYGFAGPYMPSLIAHSGLSFSSMADLLFLDDRAVFGTPAKISARYVFLFIMFGAILLESGAGDLFLNLAKSIAGSLKGGPAKMAVISSAMMATINGSAVANTVSTGSITIPLMERSGYSKESAGATEALASTGGQYMPPVMGAAAFVLAELTGVPYLQVIVYAAIPATLYYVGVLSSVHFEAVRQDISSLPPEEIPDRREAATKVAHIAIPIIGLLYIMFTTQNVEKAAAVTVVLTMAVIVIRSRTRMKLFGYLKGFRRSSEMVLSAALPCAIAGIIIGVVFYSGVASRLVGIILAISGGQLVTTLVLIALISIILGMGMPTTGAYITVAVLAIPAIVALHVPTIAAHLFGLYFAVVSMVTPPIALAAFAAASVSGGDAWQTGIKAFKMGLPVYIIPFAFVFHPVLLTLNSSPISIVIWFLIGVVLVITLAAVGVGYMFTKISWIERLVIAAGVLLVVFSPVYQLFGGVLMILGMIRQFRPFGRFLLNSAQS